MNNEIIDFLNKHIEDGCELVILTSKISFRAIYKLIPYFLKCKSVNILLTGMSLTDDEEVKDQRAYRINLDETELLTNKFELKLKNDLMDYSITQDVKKIIEEKIHIRSNNKCSNSFLCIKNKKGEYFSLSNCSEITLSSLGFVENEMFYNFQETQNAITNYNFFYKIWNDKNNEKQVKEKIIKNLKSIFEDKAPDELYYFSLSRIFKNRLEEFDHEKHHKIVDFKNTTIYKKLYEFQKHGVHSIIDRINKYNGCILADSVGLGKTFEALAVIKYFELQHKRVLVLCPKKLSNNWKQFNSPLKTNFLINDNFKYSVYHHSDLQRKKGEILDVDWSNFDLVVIDESHNFKNGQYISDEDRYQSIRYDKLMNEIILKGKKTSVLLLSATPINNTMKDIKSQIYLITGNDDNAFQDQQLNSISRICRNAESKCIEWSNLDIEDRTPKRFNQMIDLEFKKLIDLITIARSRKQIEFTYNDMDFKFPKKREPISIKPDIDLENNVMNIEELVNEFKDIIFCFYRKTHYIRFDKIEEYEKKLNWKSGNLMLKHSDREMGIVVLVLINLLKRFESSIESFRITIKRILDDNIRLLNKIELSEKIMDEELLTINFDDEEEDELLEEEIEISKSIIIKFEDLDLVRLKSDLLSDINKLTKIYDKYKVVDESRDGKLHELIKQIKWKIENPINEGNKKVIIFTSFSDTANYLFKNISKIFEKDNIYSLLVTGQKCISNHPELKNRNIEFNESLTYFSPISKELNAKQLKKNVDIDILIATDCISEGQNLQDCDFLINYDVHWNPVRLIQRFGRIDRIGSNNKEIQMEIFWPNIDLDNYIQLERTIHAKMMRMATTSSSDIDILNLKLKDQLKQIEHEVVDLEDIKGDVSLSSITLSEFTTDLKIELENNSKKYMNQPDGIFSIADSELNEHSKGVIFLFESLQKDNKFNIIMPYYLVYVSQNKEVKVTHEEPVEIMRVYKSIAQQKEINKDLVNNFNKSTNWGKNMNEYVDLLNIALKSIQDNSESKLSQIINGDYEINDNKSSSFNLISFLIID